jgi:hypothetical protein
MSAVFGSSRIVIIDGDVLGSITSAGMKTTAIMEFSILKSKSSSIRKSSHDNCLHCMAWSSISDLRNVSFVLFVTFITDLNPIQIHEIPCP